MKKSLPPIILVHLLLFSFLSQAQNIFPANGSVGIGTQAPSSTSVLDIQSTTKGILIPRLSKVQRDAIVAPATGLLIYQTNNTPGYYYHNGTSWVSIVNGSANNYLSNLLPTSVNQSLVPSGGANLSLGSGTLPWTNAFITNVKFTDFTTQTTAFVPYVAGNGITINGQTISCNAGNSQWSTNGNHIFYNIGNVGIGTNIPSAKLEVAGDALINNITIGKGGSGVTGNTAVGLNALYYNLSGSHNSVLGNGGLVANTTGSYNSAFGSGALASNTTGNENLAIGYQALTLNSTGNENHALGVRALLFNSTGNANVAVGTSALSFNSNGSSNVAVGWKSLLANSSGNYNTAIGFTSSNSSSSGSYNTALGSHTNLTANNYTNTTTLGYNAIVSADNQIRLGNNVVTSIGGYTDWTNVSDGRVKTNVTQNVPGLTFINKLQPVTYHLSLDAIDNILQVPPPKNEKGEFIYSLQKFKEARIAKEKIVYSGFIAQDVEKAAKELNYDFSGVDAAKNSTDLYGLRYSQFVVPLVKAVQELSSENDDLKEINKIQTEKLDDLQQQINELKNMVQGNKSSKPLLPNNTVKDVAKLEQNTPNPFNNATSISYYLPGAYSSAKIIVTDNSGRTVRNIKLTGYGQGKITLTDFPANGVSYFYSLYVNNNLIDTKQMEFLK
jgi:trimeric autotransporter adhesin